MFITVKDFIGSASEDLELEVLSGEKNLHRPIKEPMINRPGLALAGFFQYFANKRVQVLGLAETSYLKSLSAEDRDARLEQFFKQRIPCVLLSRGRRPGAELFGYSEKFRVPLLRSPLVTGKLINQATLAMETLTLPSTRCHGTMVSIMGMGVMIEGRSGIGKSEIALALIERGHSLVSDDLVHLSKDSTGSLVGTAPDITKYHMEIRGLGIIHVSSLFGLTSILQHKSLDLIVKLEDLGKGDELDRTGLEPKSREILETDVPIVTLPVAPGRDMANVIEVAAMNQKLKNLGHDAAKELNDKIIGNLTKEK